MEAHQCDWGALMRGCAVAAAPQWAPGPLDRVPDAVQAVRDPKALDTPGTLYGAGEVLEHPQEHLERWGLQVQKSQAPIQTDPS